MNKISQAYLHAVKALIHAQRIKTETYHRREGRHSATVEAIVRALFDIELLVDRRPGQIHKLELADSSILIDVTYDGVRLKAERPIQKGPLLNAVRQCQEADLDAKRNCMELAFLHQFLETEHIERFYRYAVALCGIDGAEVLAGTPDQFMRDLVKPYVESCRDYKCPYAKEE